jgi:hypothetical protein
MKKLYKFSNIECGVASHVYSSNNKYVTKLQDIESGEFINTLFFYDEEKLAVKKALTLILDTM